MSTQDVNLLTFEAYYENNRGERLCLSRVPYIMTEFDVFNTQWSLNCAERPLSEGCRVISAKRPLRDVHISIGIAADSASALSERLDRLSRLVEQDVIDNRAGRLYINEQYMSCRCISSEKQLSTAFPSSCVVRLTLRPETPVWNTEHHFHFVADEEDTSGGLKYPYKYPKRYGAGRRTLTVDNRQLAPAPMRVVFYGAAVEPSIFVGSAQLGLDISLDYGEYAVIDQLSHEIYRVDRDGTRTSCFNSRLKNGRIFEPVPSGISIVQLYSSGGVDITLYEQRSEPIWS